MMNKSERIGLFKKFMPDSVIGKDTTLNLVRMGFFDVPASIKYHGAYGGGLFDHSFSVAKTLTELTEKLGLEWERPESPYIVGMFHDLCKCDNYILDIETNKYIFNPDIVIPGHGEKSVILAQKYINLTDEEISCIRWKNIEKYKG